MPASERLNGDASSNGYVTSETGPGSNHVIE